MQQTSVQKQKNIFINKGGKRMFKKMKHMKNEKGLTLIELLAVIVILAIIAAIAIPAIGNIINNQRDKAVLADISGVLSAAKIANADGQCGTDSKCNKTELDNYISVPGFAAAGDEVDLSATVPTITYTLGTGENIKGSKVYSKLFAADGTTAHAAALAPGSVIKVTEAQLNTAMGK